MPTLGERLLDQLPRPLALPIYRWRHPTYVAQAEILPGLKLDLSIPARSKLWRDRLAQVAGHEPALCAWLARYLRPNEVFVDVGAAFGFFPALIQNLQPAAEIHALEASWKVFSFLKQNNARYGSRWHLREGFLSDQDNAHFLRLDTYAHKLQRPPTLVKMDVDGAEFAILTGARQLIAARKTEFLVEIHPNELPKFGTTAAAVLALFADRYRIRVLPNLRTAGPVADPDADWSDDLTWLERDPNPYLYLAPEEIARF